MFGLDKKWTRAKRQFVSDTPVRRPYPPTFVPPVDERLMGEGLTLYQAALTAAGDPKPYTTDWEHGLVHALNQLRADHGKSRADAVLARAVFFTALLRQEAFQQIYKTEGKLPTPAMLKVAGVVPAVDGDEGIDLDVFAEMLAEVF